MYFKNSNSCHTKKGFESFLDGGAREGFKQVIIMGLKFDSALPIPDTYILAYLVSLSTP